ncbi:hypothetical protein M9434_005595 [Picochlorum sp. BPE23]|nr:hypothetical protein M9434_005595 [Picochlorum sp. BPE23]
MMFSDRVKRQRRRLAQEELLCDPSVSACTASSSGESSSVQVIQGGILVTGCSIIDNSTVLSGTTIIPRLYTIAGSRRGCCATCARRDGCNAWNFCMHPSGCRVPDRLNVTAFPETPDDVSRVPYKACILLSKRPASSSSSEFFEKDSDFSSGQMSRMFMPSISGYRTFPSMNISATYDFTCGYSPTKTRCEIYGSASEISDICSADPRCKGFVFLPSITGDSSQNLGILKRGPTGGGLIEEDELIQDPQSNVYVLTEQGLEAKSPVEKSNGGSSNTVLWIVLPTIAGVLIIAMVAIMLTFALMTRTHGKALRREEEEEEEDREDVDEGHPSRVQEEEEEELRRD